MLRTEFPFKLTTRPRRLLATLLGEAFLGFLALIAAALTLSPLVFPMHPRTSAALDAAQWAIIAWFGVEYLTALAMSRARRAFLLSPWRLIDLATVVIPLVALLPNVSRMVLSSPLLRLIRLTRLVTLGVRASGVAVRHHASERAEKNPSGPAQIVVIAETPRFSPTPATWEELLAWLRAPDQAWFHVANPSPEELAQITAAARLPEGFFATHLLGTSYPHFAAAKSLGGVFLWMPEVAADGHVERHGVFFAATANSLLSLSRRPTHLIERMQAPADGLAPKEPFAVRMLLMAVEHVLRQNTRLVDAFEQELRALEDVPVRESRPAFFERTFRVKKELSATQADLWRLKGLLADLAEGRARLPGAGDEAADVFRRFAANADYLYDTVVNTRDEILSVMELHLNIVSFDMNRVMRVLAVVSVLGLVPAVVGGLFGMNLIDNPWPFTLPQVAFTICFAMVVALYVFFVKGWLR